jgi:hypothetical protein
LYSLLNSSWLSWTYFISAAMVDVVVSGSECLG